MLAGEAVILIPKEQALLCQLHFGIWVDGDQETRSWFFVLFLPHPPFSSPTA